MDEEEKQNHTTGWKEKKHHCQQTGRYAGICAYGSALFHINVFGGVWTLIDWL